MSKVPTTQIARFLPISLFITAALFFASAGIQLLPPHQASFSQDLSEVLSSAAFGAMALVLALVVRARRHRRTADEASTAEPKR